MSTERERAPHSTETGDNMRRDATNQVNWSYPRVFYENIPLCVLFSYELYTRT